MQAVLPSEKGRAIQADDAIRIDGCDGLQSAQSKRGGVAGSGKLLCFGLLCCLKVVEPCQLDSRSRSMSGCCAKLCPRGKAYPEVHKFPECKLANPRRKRSLQPIDKESD